MSDNHIMPGPVENAAPVMMINGATAQTLPASERAFQYGDGLFETVAVANARPEFWERHMARLEEGCARLKLPAPPVDEITREAEVLCNGQRAIEEVSAGVLKVIVAAGAGGRGYRRAAEMNLTRVVSFHPWPDWPPARARDGVAARLCEMKLARQPAMAGVKHLNRLENVLARAEWADDNIAEGLMCDGEGLVVEGTMSNLFCVHNGGLKTPDLSRCGVAGIIRAVVMEIAAEQAIACAVCDLPLAQAAAADELFLTNSVIGLWPVKELDGKAYEIGDITRALQTALGVRRAKETA